MLPKWISAADYELRGDTYFYRRHFEGTQQSRVYLRKIYRGLLAVLLLFGFSYCFGTLLGADSTGLGVDSMFSFLCTTADDFEHRWRIRSRLV